MRTKAVRTDSGYVLNGVKRWITNAGVSKYYTVMAVTDLCIGASNGILLRRSCCTEDEKAKKGSATWRWPFEHKLGIKGSPTRELYFDDCQIPASRLVGAEEGEGLPRSLLRTLDHNRITIAAQALGIAQGALDYALGYIRERKQFGRPVADFQGIQFMVADMAMRLEAARQLTYAAAAKSERAISGEQVPSTLTFFSSACKCYWPPTSAMHVRNHRRGPASRRLRLRQRLLPGPERMMRDAKITQNYEGTTQIQRMVMARQLAQGLVGGEPMTCEFSYPSAREGGPSTMRRVSTLTVTTRASRSRM